MYVLWPQSMQQQPQLPSAAALHQAQQQHLLLPPQPPKMPAPALAAPATMVVPPPQYYYTIFDSGHPVNGYLPSAPIPAQVALVDSTAVHHKTATQLSPQQLPLPSSQQQAAARAAMKRKLNGN